MSDYATAFSNESPEDPEELIKLSIMSPSQKKEYYKSKIAALEALLADRDAALAALRANVANQPPQQ